MEKKKIISSAAAILLCGTLVATGDSPSSAAQGVWAAMRQTAFLAAGIVESESASPQTAEPPSAEAAVCDEAGSSEESAETEEMRTFTAELPLHPDVDAITADAPEASARVISQSITEYDDGIDRTAAGNNDGAIYRRHYGGYVGDDYITLSEGGLVWNCTDDSADKLRSAAEELPDISIELNTAEPQVLIVHTHTTESYEPYQRSYYDSEYPVRTMNPDYNMVRVGEELAARLAAHGISVVHDGTINDYPAYTGAYDRSEETIRAALEQYPSIKVIIDLHRDAIASEDGSRIAPVAEINGRSAAQFMIITGCDDGRFGNMPNYLENFRLACLIQNSAERLYSGLARPVLMDYRNYNQHISTGSLLIEIGSHANSIDEAVYTAQLLGDCLADALAQLSEE